MRFNGNENGKDNARREKKAGQCLWRWLAKLACFLCFRRPIIFKIQLISGARCRCRCCSLAAVRRFGQRCLRPTRATHRWSQTTHRYKARQGFASWVWETSSNNARQRKKRRQAKIKQNKPLCKSFSFPKVWFKFQQADFWRGISQTIEWKFLLEARKFKLRADIRPIRFDWIIETYLLAILANTTPIPSSVFLFLFLFLFRLFSTPSLSCRSILLAVFFSSV